MTPDMIPTRYGLKVIVGHCYPDGWTEEEKNKHRYDECPCVPLMMQEFGEEEDGYRWRVLHRSI